MFFSVDVFLQALGVFLEFFPVSSSAHMWLLSHMCGVPFGGGAVLLSHALPLFALFIYCVPTFLCAVRDGVRSVRSKRLQGDFKLCVVVLSGLVPLVVIALAQRFFGWSLDDSIQVFSKGRSIGFGFVAGGVILLFADWRGAERRSLRQLAVWQGCLIGVLQSFSLIPGLSRLGLCMAACRLLGLSRKDALYFGFLSNFFILVASNFLCWRDSAAAFSAWGWWEIALMSGVGVLGLLLARLVLVGRGVAFCALYRVLLGVLLLLVF